MVEFKLGDISRKQYIEKCNKIDDGVIAKLRGLDKTVLDNVEEYRFF